MPISCEGMLEVTDYTLGPQTVSDINLLFFFFFTPLRFEQSPLIQEVYYRLVIKGE